MSARDHATFGAMLLIAAPAFLVACIGSAMTGNVLVSAATGFFALACLLYAIREFRHS